MAIRGIGFDIDGTMYPANRMYILALPILFKNPRLLYHFSAARSKIRQTGQAGDDFYDWQAAIMAQTMRRPEKEVREIVRQKLYGEFALAFKKLRPFPYFKDTVDRFRQKGLRLAVLSDFPIDQKLTYLGVENYWDTAFSSEEIGCLKPHRKTFFEMASRLELEPREMLYVGNNYSYDIQGARKAGMMTAYYTTKRRNFPEADYIFRDYRQLRDYVLRLTEN